jgi:YVTN family beta-propeller protein
MIRSSIHLLFIVFIYTGLNCHSQGTNNFAEKEKLTLVSKIILPKVSGRIDHISYDSAGHLAFIAALGNNTVEVVNTTTQKVIHTITGLHEPQGIVHISSLKKLVVANGDNGDCVFFDESTYTQSAVVPLKDDADNIRYDAASHLLYIGNGTGSIAVIDAATMKKTGDIALDDHPESFQLSKKLNRMYINVPGADEIEVADLSTNKIVAKWKNIGASSNFPMALDEKNDRLFIGYRSPANLQMINTGTGKDIAVSSCSGDADDVFYNPFDSLVFISAGKGFIDVFRANGKELTHIDHIKTSAGARTSLLLAAEKKFLLAVPARGSNPAALWIYNID